MGAGVSKLTLPRVYLIQEAAEEGGGDAFLESSHLVASFEMILAAARANSAKTIPNTVKAIWAAFSQGLDLGVGGGVGLVASSDGRAILSQLSNARAVSSVCLSVVFMLVLVLVLFVFHL
jgi:hypothetical protein